MTAFTIATWNVMRPGPTGTRRLAELRRWIDRVAADIWVLTETHESLTPGHDYTPVSTIGTDRAHRPGERWATIWSRLPIERLGETSDPTRAVVARVQLGVDGSALPATSAGRGLIIYGTVLPWVGSVWRDIAWRDGAFAAALAAQAADWRALRDAYPDDDLFVLGDLNQDLVDGPPRYYGSVANGRLLRDALDGAGLLALTAGEGDPLRRGAGPEMQGAACIDHICMPKASAGVRWRAGAVWRWPDGARSGLKGVSDHFGVGVRVEAI